MTYILTLEDFQNEVDISKFIRVDVMNQSIGRIQERWGIAILCQELYNELIDQLTQAGGQIEYLDTELQALLPVLKKFLIYKTASDYVLVSSYQSTPAGMRKATEPTSEALSSGELSIIKKNYDDFAEYYKNNLLDFLHKKKDDYPLWKDSKCACNYDLYSKGHNFLRYGTGAPRKVNIRWT